VAAQPEAAARQQQIASMVTLWMQPCMHGSQNSEMIEK
jgi:hypothetical protein